MSPIFSKCFQYVLKISNKCNKTFKINHSPHLYRLFFFKIWFSCPVFHSVTKIIFKQLKKKKHSHSIQALKKCCQQEEKEKWMQPRNIVKINFDRTLIVLCV